MERSAVLLKAFVIFAVLQVADLGTTIAVFRLGGVELNPLLQHIMAVGPVLGLIIAKAIALGIGIGCYLAAKYRTLYLANVIFAGIVIWNLTIIARLARISS